VIDLVAAARVVKLATMISNMIILDVLSILNLGNQNRTLALGYDFNLQDKEWDFA
jgi:hypothetical protein